MIDIKYEGYCDPSSLPVKAGDTITLLKGMKYRWRGKDKVVNRKYKIKVYLVMGGMTNTRHQVSPVHVLNPSIRWAGSGGYWNDMDINEYLNGSANVGE